MSWTQIKSAFTSATSTVVVDRPTRLRSLYIHNDLPGTLYVYDASAAVSVTGTKILQVEMPHRASTNNPDSVAIYIPDAGLRCEQAMFVKVSGAANCGITLFFD
jgi:hypothetical protein